MEIQENMASVIRAFKDLHKKSLDEFADELGISRSALQEYLSGNGNPNLNTLKQIASSLNIDVTFLITGSFSDSQLHVIVRLFEIHGVLPDISQSDRIRVADMIRTILNIWLGGAENV